MSQDRAHMKLVHQLQGRTKKYCEVKSCINIACYGNYDEGKLYCSVHKRHQDILVRSCLDVDCRQIRSVNSDYCDKHKHIDYISKYRMDIESNLKDIYFYLKIAVSMISIISISYKLFTMCIEFIF